MATSNGREGKRVGGEFHDSDKNKHTEEPFSKRNCCDHKQAGKEDVDTAEELQSLFTRMNPGGAMLSEEDRMDVLLKLKRIEASND